MKKCPNCSMELPDEAHFCPRCMFQYEKQEIQIKDSYKKRRLLRVLISVLIIAVFIMISLVRNSIQNIEKSDDLDESEIQKIIDENFRTDENISYDSEIEHDLRDMLGRGFDDVKSIFGEETQEIYYEQGMTVHTFGMLTVAVNQGGAIQDVLIDYTEGENKKEYGIYGIDGTSDVEAVKVILGTPGQEYENELIYRFDREFNPGVIVTFSEDGIVEQLEYYFVS